MDLIEFDLSDIPDNPSIVLAGKRRSGKNVLCKDLCYNFFRGKVKNVFVFSPTSEIAINGYDYVPFEFRYTEVDIDVIDRIMKRQEYLIRNDPKGDHRTLIIIDDIIASNDSKQQKILDKLFICARHYQISLIVSYQYIKKDFSPVQRDNVDVIFVFQQSNYDNKQAFNIQYLSVNDNKKDGLELINKYAVDYQTLVILNTVSSPDYSDFCFYYTADLIEKKFKLGKDYE
jgi:archaellum biogenesis ATPase FlaH